MKCIRFWVPSQYWKWDVVLQWDASIDVWIFHNLDLMYYTDCWIFWQHLHAPYNLHCVIPAKHNSQISWNISDFRYPLSVGKGMMCYKETHPLLLDRFIILLSCIGMIIGPSDSMCEPLMVHNKSFVLKTNLKFHTKYHMLGTLSAQ